MKITQKNTIAFQKENYNFTMNRIQHIDLKRLNFELNRFDVFKKIAKNCSKFKIEFNDEKDSLIVFSLEQVAIGAIEQLLNKLINMMSQLDDTCCFLPYGFDRVRAYNETTIRQSFNALKRCLSGDIILCPAYFDRVSHEYIYHKNKTQKSFYEVYYTNLCNEFESFLSYLENFDMGVLNMYFDMCDKFFKHSYQECKSKEVL